MAIELDIVTNKYKNMSKQERLTLLLARFPEDMLAEEDTYFTIIDGIVAIDMTGAGEVVSSQYVGNDRY